MSEKKRMGKNIVSLFSISAVAYLMCLLAVGMLGKVIIHDYGKYLLQIIHCLILFIAYYPFFYSLGVDARLHEQNESRIGKQFIYLLVVLVFCFYISPVLLLMMKLKVLADFLPLYKLINVPFWGILMRVMDTESTAAVSAAALCIAFLIPLYILFIALCGFVFGYRAFSIRGIVRSAFFTTSLFQDISFY